MGDQRSPIRFAMAIAVALGLLLLAGCASAATPTAAPKAAEAPKPAAPAPTQAPAKAPEGAAKSSGVPAAETIAPPALDGRMIVRTAKMSVIVDDVSAKLAALSSVVVERGGYISASSAKDDGVVSRGQIVMKLPPPQLDAAMADVRKLVTKVSTEDATSQDLTEEYYDVDAQLRALKAQEAQYLEFMKKAVNIDETLRVQAAITGVRVEINRLEGRSRFIERSSAMSTLTVEMQTAPPIVEEKRVNEKVSREWPDAFAAVRETFFDMTRFLAELGVVVLRLAIWLPVWGPIVAFFYLLRRRAVRAGAKPVAGASAEPGKTPATTAAMAAALAAAGTSAPSAVAPAEASATISDGEDQEGEAS